MNFEEAMIYINSFSQSGRKVTDLSRIKKLLNLIGNPQDNLKFVHIAGTNGKGSVLEYCSNALINAGYKTGQFTSPYIKEYCDRIRINGQNIPKEKVAYYCMYVKKYADNLFFSQFEITFAIALLYYKEEACDIVFLEAGIGGELDATNIISSPLVSVITSVSLDHTQILGDTIEEIAVQKVGIIKENSYAVLSYDNEESVKKIALSKAFEKGSTLIVPDSSQIYIDKLNLKETEFRYKNKLYKLKMCGKHQIVNAVTAIEILSILNNIKFKISYDHIYSALSSVSVELRTEIVRYDPLVIIDGGHNIAGINSLCEILRNSGEERFVGLIGMVKGKAYEYAAEKLSEIFEYVFCAEGFIENNIPAEKLCDLFKKNNCPAEYCEYREALKKACNYSVENSAALIVRGSLYFCSAVKSEFLINS